MDNKSPDAFRTISEVAEDLDLPQHVLRFWETRFTQIKPMKRGGGRRYYRPDDIELLKGSGDLAAAEALSASMAEDKPAPRAQATEEDQLVGKAKLPSTRRFFGLGGENGKPDAEAPEGGAGGLKRDDRALLQEALYDLLECKRLLDQVR